MHRVRLSLCCNQTAKVTAKFSRLLRLVRICDQQLAKIGEAAAACGSAGAQGLAELDEALQELTPLLQKAGKAMDEYSSTGFLLRFITCSSDETAFLQLQGGIEDVMHVRGGGARGGREAGTDEIGELHGCSKAGTLIRRAPIISHY